MLPQFDRKMIGVLSLCVSGWCRCCPGTIALAPNGTNEMKWMLLGPNELFGAVLDVTTASKGVFAVDKDIN